MRFAIIGYGRMGKLYDRFVQCDYIVDTFPVKNRLYFSSIDEFIFYKPDVDLVIISSSADSHYFISKKLLVNNYNVLVEKPICLSSLESSELEKIARQKGLILYQSTLERYNPVIKYFKNNIDLKDIERIESYRIGIKPDRFYVEDVKFDLGIHDVDLYFYLVKQKIKWTMHFDFGSPRREIIVHLKNNKTVFLNLLKKTVYSEKEKKDFTSFVNNPILEMIEYIQHNRFKVNEKWSSEIALLEESSDNIIALS